MSRLTLMRFYLVGPMDHDRESGREWRDDLSEWLFSRKAIPLNPYYKPLRDAETALEDDDNFHRRVEALKNGEFDLMRDLMNPVISTDLRMVDHCDAIICNMDLTKNPCGTWDEIITAANQNKPVIVHAAQGKKNLPHWMFSRWEHELFFDTWGEIKNYLDHVNTADHVCTLDKWKFFDYEPLVRKALGISEYVGG